METFRSLPDIRGFVGADGARVQELSGNTTGLPSHSLAVITHPPGSTTRDHHHSTADEVYFVHSGQGRIRLEEEAHDIKPGDVVIIRPGQPHKLWNEGPDDLVLIVSCAPAYRVDEVVWDED